MTRTSAASETTPSSRHRDHIFPQRAKCRGNCPLNIRTVGIAVGLVGHASWYHPRGAELTPSNPATPCPGRRGTWSVQLRSSGIPTITSRCPHSTCRSQARPPLRDRDIQSQRTPSDRTGSSIPRTTSPSHPALPMIHPRAASRPRVEGTWTTSRWTGARPCPLLLSSATTAACSRKYVPHAPYRAPREMMQCLLSMSPVWSADMRLPHDQW